MLGPEDAEMFRALRLQGLRDHPEAFGASYEDEEALPIRAWEERLHPARRMERAYFGAFSGGRLMGMIGFYRHQGRKMAHKAAIVAMYVAPEFRKQGVAKRLIAAVIGHVQEHKIAEQLHLAVVAGNQSAISLYEQLGFVAYGKEPRALKIGETYHDELLMVKRLV
jgi:ribosomal protein S18 acetylase RimI-like enzyme